MAQVRQNLFDSVANLDKLYFLKNLFDFILI